MESNQLLEDLSRAMEAAKPAQEFCFFGIQHWSTCMTKSEWSGWMQAIFRAANTTQQIEDLRLLLGAAG